MSHSWLHVYQGQGRQTGRQVTPLKPLLEGPSGYLASAPLQKAVNVALALQQPLLLAGKPGTGKTDLAASIAWELNLPLFKFYVKSASTATELLYRYDALRHFHASNFSKNREPDPRDFIEVTALGQAILCTRPENHAADLIDRFLPEKYRGKEPVRSVVLIDEIDKAPRDFPNDLLNEVEHYEFTIKETNDHFKVREGLRPILILTSNSEKSLPEAFLRRCLFHYIDPPTETDLKEIIKRRLGDESPLLANAISWFKRKRDSLGLEISTGELLQWVRLLRDLDIDVENLKPGESELLAVSYAALAKTEEAARLLQPAPPSSNE